MKHIKGPLILEVKRPNAAELAILISDVFTQDGKIIVVEAGWDDPSNHPIHLLKGEMKGDISTGLSVGKVFTLRPTKEEDDIAETWKIWSEGKHDEDYLKVIVADSFT